MCLSFFPENKSSFFIIDEPNELLDPNNINSMKSLFARLFKNKQIIICTFIENYKLFKPALIYQIVKDPKNISFVTQIYPRRGKKDFYHLEEEVREAIRPKLEEMGFNKIESGATKVEGFFLT